MSGHTVIVLGAGFSKPAGGPLLAELLATEYIERSDANTEALEAVRGLLGQPRGDGFAGGSIEDLFTEIWREARTAGSIVVDDRQWGANTLLIELTTHLASVCGRLHVRRGTGLWAAYLAYLGWLIDNSKTLTFITFNYDLLLEQLLDDRDLRYGYGHRSGVEFDDPSRRRRVARSGAEVQLLKLHGSSNWGVCRGCRKAGVFDDSVTAFEAPYMPGLRRKTCPRCKEKYLESGIIPPILGKAGESRPMEAIWRAARAALRRAREIVVIGYSLPESDLEAVSLFREVESPLKRPRIKLVCGARGAPASYARVFTRFSDTRQYFEEYAVLATS